MDTTDVDQFEQLLLSLGSGYMVKGIAEEMNEAALAERGISETVAQVVSSTLTIDHQLSDPPPEIRKEIGVRSENEIRVDGWLQHWGPERIESEIRRSHEIREEYWLKQLQLFNRWPALFICGANHAEPFSMLLRKTGIEVVIAFADWVPNPSSTGSTQKATQAGKFNIGLNERHERAEDFGNQGDKHE